jgi:hypothetical protein
MLNQRTWEACPIDYTEALGNIYGNKSQTCRSKAKTYKGAQLKELVHSTSAEHVPEHEVVYRSEPTEEKHGEGETVAKQQPARALGREDTTAS